MAFRFQRFNIPEVILVEPQQMIDQRGCFAEIYIESLPLLRLGSQTYLFR